MRETFLKLKNSKAVGIIKNILSWKYFPFITAIIIVGCYYLNLDLFSIYFIGLTGLFSVLFLDDLTPLFSNFLFMCIMVSYDHSPSVTAGLSDYYLNPVIYSQAIAVTTLYALGVVARIAMTALDGRLKLTPAFYGLAAFAFFLLLNGSFSANYNPANLAYGFFLAFLFLGIYTVMKDNVVCNKENFEKIAYAFLALSIALCLELVVKYMTRDVFLDGKIYRNVLCFGWGMYNTMGMLMMLCVPPVFFLAAIKKFGYLYYVYALALCIATIFTMSRQSMIGLAIIYPICIILLLVNGKNKIINGAITGIAAITAIIVLSMYWENVKIVIEVLTTNIDSGNIRIDLWEIAWENFKSNPVFGVGFYVELKGDPGFPGLKLIPDMYHNTFFQLLGACGITGLVSYIIHRAQTVLSFIKNPTIERTYIGLTLLSLLILNLLDNHLFYILPTIIYSALTAVLIKTQDDKSLFLPNN